MNWRDLENRIILGVLLGSVVGVAAPASILLWLKILERI